jgi:hypothetical protein
MSIPCQLFFRGWFRWLQGQLIQLKSKHQPGATTRVNSTTKILNFPETVSKHPLRTLTLPFSNRHSPHLRIIMEECHARRMWRSWCCVLSFSTGSSPVQRFRDQEGGTVIFSAKPFSWLAVQSQFWAVPMQLEDPWFLFEKWLDPYQDMLEKNAWAGVGGKWHISPYGQPKTGLFTRQLSKWNGIYFEFYQYWRPLM